MNKEIKTVKIKFENGNIITVDDSIASIVPW